MRFSTVFPQLFHMVFHSSKIELPWRAIVCCANRTSSVCPYEIAVGGKHRLSAFFQKTVGAVFDRLCRGRAAKLEESRSMAAPTER